MVVVTAIKPPIHANRGPINVAKEPTTPLLAPRPMPNSAIIKGRDQIKRKSIQGIRNAAPPFSAAIRGNLHRFPVPTARPRPARINPHREENLSPRAKRPKRPLTDRQTTPPTDVNVPQKYRTSRATHRMAPKTCCIRRCWANPAPPYPPPCWSPTRQIQ